MSGIRFAIAAVVVALVAPFATAPSAQATRLVTGNDYSWPQCPKGVGNGQGSPLPKGTHDFAVVGLTNGVALHQNPCVSAHWAYANAHARWLTGYTMANYPSGAELRASSTGHYGTCATAACRLRNYGWAQGDYTSQTLQALHAHPPLVWVDVEPRDKHPWSKSRARNGLVLRALFASLHAHGYSVGVYSNRRMWGLIAGFRISMPEWVPSARLTAGCNQPFAGGHVVLSQWTHVYRSGNAYDENVRCAGAPPVTRWWQRAGSKLSP